MNRIHRFGDNAEIDEKNRVKMYKKGSQWVTANQTSFMLLGKHALTKGLAITLGTVALGLTSGQAASADSVASTSSGTQPTTGETTNSSDSGSSNMVTLKSSVNTSEEDNGTTTSGNSNTDQAASTTVMTNFSASEALQANLASMSTTSSSLNTDSKSTTTTANEQSSDASSVIDNAGQNSKAQSGTITLSEMYKNDHLPDLQEKLYDGDRAVRTTEFHPDEIFDNTQVDYDQGTSTKTINNVWNQNYLNFNLNTYVSKELALGTPKDGLFYNLQIDDRLAKHITKIQITNSNKEVFNLSTRAEARKAGQNVGDYDDDVYCAEFNRVFPNTGIFSSETRTASGVIYFDGVIKDILSQATDNDFTKLPLGYRSYVSYEGNMPFTTTSLTHGNQTYPSKSILGASYTNGFFITPTQHIPDSAGKDDGMDGGYIGAPMFSGFVKNGIFAGGTDDVYYDVKNRAIIIDNYINRKSEFTYKNNGWKYDLKIDPRLLPFIKVEQTRDAQWNPVTSYGNVERIYFKNGTYSTHYTREEIRNQPKDTTADLIKETRKTYRDPQDGEFVADLNNVAPNVEKTRPWIIRTVLPLGEDSQGRLYTLTSILKSIFENTADSAKQPALQFQTYMDNGYGKMIEGTTSSNLSSFAELANSVSDNTEDQGLFVIDFVDENQTAQGAFTLEGKAGSTQEFTADFPDGWTFAGDPSKLPNGWTINSQGQLTGTATMQSFNSAQATWLLVKHGTYTVTHNAATQGKLVAKGGIIPGTTAKKFAQDINYTDLNKTLTRTVIIDDPHTGKQTTPQTVDFARDAIVDMVTGEIISYTPWQAVDPSTRNYDTEGKYNYYNNIPVPTVDGYTPSQTTIEKVYPNGTSDTNTSIEITYTANAGTQTINYQYEKADGSLVNVGTQVVNGKTDEKINKITWELPDGYALAEGVSLPSEVTIQATDTPITIKVDHLKVTVTHDKPQVAGALIPGTKDKHFGTGVTQDNLNHTVKRIINITYPDDTAAKQIVQEVKFVQDATVDAVTGEVTYTGWSNADTNTKFEALDSTALGLKSIDGYKPTKTSVAEAVPGGGDNDQTINISYTRNGDVSQTFTLIDVNDNAKEYTVTLSGTKGTTGAYKDISALLPSGMTFNDPNDESKTFKYVESGPAIQIRVKHQTQSQANDQKAVTREIILQLPDGTNKTETQSVSFERSVTRDLFNDHLTYGSWQNADPTKTGFEEYTPAPQAGYHPISTSESFKDGKVIAIDNVSVDTVYPAVTIIYAADDQSFKIIYQDEQGKVIQNDTIISGKTGTTVKINSTVPTGWKLADGQTVPSEFTFTTTAAKDQTYTIKHAVVTVSADNPKTINDQLPDNPAKKYPKGVDYDDLNKDVTRTIIINLPNGTVQTLKDTVAFTRSADVDEVDGTVKYNNWTSTNSNWNDRTSEIPDVAGYTKLYQDTDGKTLAESAVQSQAVNSDTPNSTVKVSYSADAQTVTVNYVDDQNNVIGHSSSLSGKTDKEMQIDKSQLNNLPENWIIDDSQTFPITFTPSSDASKNVVNVKVKHVTKVTINYLDDQNNETGYSSSLNGEAGTPMQITKEQLSIPDGWTVDDSQTLPITFTPDTDATKNVVNVKIKHLIVKVNNDNYYSGKLIPGTKAKHFGDYDLSHVVQRNIYIHYEKIGRGSSDLPAGSARFTREAWVDAVTGEIVSYEKWVSKGDSFGEYLLSNEGHGFDPSDIENFAKVYKVNGQFADSTVLDKVTPYVNEDGDIVTEVGGITVKNNDVNIDVDYLYLKNLSDVLNTVPATKQTYKYLNASSDKAKAYDTSVTDGQNLLKKLEDTSIVQTSTQADIDAAMNAITKAEAELDGKETNYKDLQKAVDDAPTNKQTDAYLNATDQKVYDKAVAAGDDILKAHTSGSIYSQADVDAAVKAIKDAL
ncbi:mucin-binding protein, partial [Limosilactobacillus mucosae]